MKTLKAVALSMVFAAGIGGMVMAGSIDSPGAPGSSASKMPAVGAIYTYLTTGTPAPTPGASFTEPSAAPAGTGHTLTEIYEAVATPFPQCDATVYDVSSGKKFFCAVSGSWGLKTGKLLTSYYYLLKTGPTSVYVTGDDGSKGKGKAFSYTNTTSNSVTDNVTGLMWAKDGAGAGCRSGSTIVWMSAIAWAVGLTFDGYSDWRLPNLTELQSILVRDASLPAPYVNQTYFTNTVSSNYWSSTTCPSATLYSLTIDVSNDGGNIANKTSAGYCVRAVRGGS